MKYKIKIGKTVNVAAANCNCVSLPASEANEVKPLFNSLMLSSLVTNNGHRNEFQPEMKLKSATVNKPPLDSPVNHRSLVDGLWNWAEVAL